MANGDEELKKNGIDPDEFEKIHTTSSCILRREEIDVHKPPVGRVDEFEFRLPVYVMACDGHAVSSRRYTLLGNEIKVGFRG